jgi:hypothetical protein
MIAAADRSMLVIKKKAVSGEPPPQYITGRIGRNRRDVTLTCGRKRVGASQELMETGVNRKKLSSRISRLPACLVRILLGVSEASVL